MSLVVALGLLGLTTFLPTARALPVPPFGTGPGHVNRVMPPPSGGGFHLSLSDISVVSENDVWVVGSRQRSVQSLIFAEHWDGERWTRAALPKLGGHRMNSSLDAIDAIASDNVWAVGSAGHTANPHPLVLHFDGTSWTRIESRVFGQLVGSFAGIADAGPANIWMVGRWFSNGAKTLAVQWDGERWTRWDTKDPVYSIDTYFSGVCMPAPGQALAVGLRSKGNGTKPLVEVWNGTRWRIEKGARVGEPYSGLNAVACLGDDVWATGRAETSSTETALVEHRTPDGWSRSSEAELANSVLYDAMELAPDDVWIAGSQTAEGDAVVPLVEHWTGQTWLASTVPHTYNGAELHAIDADGPDDVWVAGMDGGIVVDRWNGTTWVRML